MTDYKKAKDRLKKKDYKLDFNLTDGDDFFGYNIVPCQTWEKVLLVFIGMGAGLVILLALMN